MDATRSQSKYLVTGASGFIGSHLIAALLEMHGPRSVMVMAHPLHRTRDQECLDRLRRDGVKVVECDLLALPQLDLEPPRFEVVYHLAAAAEPENPAANFLVNSEGTRNLLDWLGGRLRGQRLIYAGTLASVDRDRPVGPITEGTPCTPKTLYGRTKLEGEDHIRRESKRLGFDFTILRLCTIIGRGYRPGGMFCVCPRLLGRNALATRLNWPGRISFLCMFDLVRILLRLPELPQTANEVFVVSNGETVTFDELLDQMARVLGLNRAKIRLPGWIWSLVSMAAWRIAASTATPYRLQNFCWRVSHMVNDGLYADNSKLAFLFGNQYQSVVDGLREAYGKQVNSCIEPRPTISEQTELEERGKE